MFRVRPYLVVPIEKSCWHEGQHLKEGVSRESLCSYCISYRALVYTQYPVHFHLSSFKIEYRLSDNAILSQLCEARFVYTGGRIFMEKVPVTMVVIMVIIAENPKGKVKCPCFPWEELWSCFLVTSADPQHLPPLSNTSQTKNWGVLWLDLKSEITLRLKCKRLETS